MKALATAALMAILACVSTQATHLAGFDPARPKTCPQAIRVYASAEAVGAPYVELAYLKTEASDPVGNEEMIASMKDKAAELGATAVLLKGIHQVRGGPGLVSTAFQTKPEGEAVALWVPRDSATVRAACDTVPTSR